MTQKSTSVSCTDVTSMPLVLKEKFHILATHEKHSSSLLLDSTWPSGFSKLSLQTDEQLFTWCVITAWFTEQSGFALFLVWSCISLHVFSVCVLFYSFWSLVGSSESIRGYSVYLEGPKSRMVSM